MQGTTWISFFRRVPVNLHDCMAITMTTGAEIVLQSVVKLDVDFAILRGRMAGTTDGARVTIIPYNMMVSVAFNRRMTDAEVQKVFGAGGPMAAAMELGTAGGEAAASEAAPEATPPEPEPAPPPAPPPVKPPVGGPMPSKTMLLAKLRARLAEGNDAAGSK